MAYLVAGALVAIIGIVAIFFVLRRKSVEQRSMYSARRSQIEHKVKAARQRTLAPHGHAEKAPEPAPAGAASVFDQAKAQPTVTYDVAAYQAPPAAPPAPPPARPERAPEAPPWEQPPTPAPTAPSFDYPPRTEPFRPAPEPTPKPSSEPSWTPAPRPAEPLPPAEPVSPAASVAAASSTSAGGWSVVSTAKESAAEASPSKKKKKDKGGAAEGDWSLASGDAPGMEGGEVAIRRPSGKMSGIALYAIMVVGLVMVLLGVLIMVANSHVT